MIKRGDYHLFMMALLEMMANSKDPDNDPSGEFSDGVQRLIMASYEINTECGRVEHIDITTDLQAEMGQSWAAFHDAGIREVEFLQFYIHDDLLLETGRMTGTSHDHQVTLRTLTDMPKPTLQAFAKGMVLAMRKHELRIYADIVDGTIYEDSKFADNLGLAQLVRQYMAEEVDEAVAKFGRQLDSVFGVADITLPPPKGVRNDDIPEPPL